MIELAIIRKRVARFGGLNFQPSTPEAWIELCKVLQRRCQSMDHIERVIERWIESEENAPKPVQLARLCAEVPADPAAEHLELALPCDVCAPEGFWRYVERIGADGVPIDSVSRCNCRRGRQLAAADAKHAAELEERNKKRGGGGNNLLQFDNRRREGA